MSLDQVMENRRELFSVPWTKEGFYIPYEDNAMFLVVERKDRFWDTVDFLQCWMRAM